MNIPFDWEVGMKGLAVFLATGAGLDNNRIKWVGQSGTLPVTPWISAKLMATRGVGTDGRSLEQNPLVLASRSFDSADVDVGDDDAAIADHPYVTGDGPIRLTTTDTLPSPLAIDTDYWILASSGHVQFVASRAAAVDEAPTAIDLIDVGVGVHTIVSTDDTRRVLKEIKHVSKGHRVAVLSLQCFADDAIYGARGQAILERIRNSYRLPGQQELLRAAGFGVSNFGAVSNVGGSKSSASSLEPRAVCEVTLTYVDGATEEGTTIETLELRLIIEDPPVDETYTVTREGEA